MKLEDQVVSLELAKKLKELGVKQESLFYWSRPWPLGTELLQGGQEYRVFDVQNPDSIAAFTVAELGEMLPMLFSSSRRVEKVFNKYNDKITHADSEADARAKMLIYLLENQILTR